MLSKIIIIFASVIIGSLADEWGDFGDNFVSTIQPLKGNELGTLNVSQILTYDENNEKTIYGFTDALVGTLKKCQEIVVASYKVANYTPDLHNNEHAMFWKNEVIPNLVETLNQDVKARNVIIRSLSTISDLSITIQKAAEIVVQSKGSAKSKEIAKKNIPAALEDLSKSIEEASGLDNIALKRFSNQTGELLLIIGPEAADFIKQKSEIQEQLDKLHKKQENIFIELAQKQGKAAQISVMISSIEKKMGATQNEIEETKNRLGEMDKLNKNLDEAIQKIPDTVQQQIITHSSGGWWLWHHSEDHVTTIQVKNPNKDIDTKYYERTIQARMDRIKQVENDQDAKRKIAETLAKDLSELKGSYNATIIELGLFKEQMNKILNQTQGLIETQNSMIKKIDQTEINITGMTGLSGQTLIQCLASVKAFAQSLEKGTTVYSPLVAILKAIRAVVQENVELLGSDIPSDIYLSINNLLKQVKFLSTYSLEAVQVLKATTSYSLLMNSFEIDSEQFEYLRLN